ncbi:DNA mismatch endonuclease Vsr [Pseudothauera nasutitermitis]|uniref:Very short patch repair endonuclease n=1 Tax=Pseudothauera nasutitermitis TaxID=2565930 RepID=A0A4S4AP26_9RHOO|nr:DNA mismatch endonuclease Vsr [Pseudothauera nasutitermitis]THF61408.1 DNA mismatch endonuclease Vsr [Pseudothauera nasutitermitis]
MSDPLAGERRSALMRSVRRSDTTPEIVVRRLLHALGVRFRLHRKDLPGTPDIVLPGRRTVIFVHGCFWHRHEGCSKATFPKTRRDFWSEKFVANVARDVAKTAALEGDGWKVRIVWECETRDRYTLALRLADELGIAEPDVRQRFGERPESFRKTAP